MPTLTPSTRPRSLIPPSLRKGRPRPTHQWLYCITIAGLVLLTLSVAVSSLLRHYRDTTELTNDAYERLRGERFSHRHDLVRWLGDETDDPNNARLIANQVKTGSLQNQFGVLQSERILKTLSVSPDLPKDAQIVLHRVACDPVTTVIEMEVRDEQGRFIHGLNRATFEISENGNRIARVFVGETTGSKLRCSIALAIDVSRSMEGRPLADAQIAARRFIEEVIPLARMQLWSFSDRVTEMTAWTTDLEELYEAMTSLKIGSQTELYGAIQHISDKLSARSGNRQLVVLSDGQDSSRRIPKEVVIDALNRNDVSVHAIAFGKATDQHAALAEIATRTHGTIQYAATERELSKALIRIRTLNQRSVYRLVLASPPKAQFTLRIQVGHLKAVEVPVEAGTNRVL